jgi:hypothetical protein
MAAPTDAAGFASRPHLTVESDRSLLQFLTLDSGQLVAVDPIVLFIIRGSEMVPRRIDLGSGQCTLARILP